MFCINLKKYSLLLVLFAFAQLQFIYGDRYCYNNDQDPYIRFATKTAYNFVFDEKDPEEVPGCEPAQVWMLARHGTRNPSKDELGPLQELNPLRDQIIKNHETRTDGRLCYPDKENLKNWQLRTGKTIAATLTKQGRTDMSLLGSRMRTNFPSLFREGYREDRYVFRHTQKERTKESAEIFANKLFGHDKIVIPPGIKNDGLIRSYSNCTTWEDLMENKDGFKEYELFRESEEVQSLLKNVSYRLGFKYNLTLDKIDTMYDMCRYDKSWNLNEASPWCACFSKEELKVLEYMQDLRYYYEAGYGHDINIKLGCPLVKDMVDRFRALAKELEDGKRSSGTRNEQPRGIFYFTHTKALLMLLARLGIAEDEQKLTHTDYRSAREREWQTSQLSPFSANLVMVFYNCHGSQREPQVMMYLQGRKVNYKGCRVGLCNWKYLEDKLGPIADKCDLSFCEDGAGGASNLVFSQILVLLAVFFSTLSSRFLR
ncbi:multiple inositol polyphosphate phosphatase 1 [Hetaerina americana]|uniref:multiple inositol polyphosphate phosphatase 1 n=1 Tax=Hetaerina americana TaxID=62018 RepID=UPI003A7F58C8